VDWLNTAAPPIGPHPAQIRWSRSTSSPVVWVAATPGTSVVPAPVRRSAQKMGAIREGTHERLAAAADRDTVGTPSVGQIDDGRKPRTAAGGRRVGPSERSRDRCGKGCGEQGTPVHDELPGL
jgi:hypothetical protein